MKLSVVTWSLCILDYWSISHHNNRQHRLQFDILKNQIESHIMECWVRFQSGGIKEINVKIYSQSETQSPLCKLQCSRKNWICDQVVNLRILQSIEKRGTLQSVIKVKNFSFHIWWGGSKIVQFYTKDVIRCLCYMQKTKGITFYGKSSDV